jgi:ATP-dependent DNA helicase PIF1
LFLIAATSSAPLQVRGSPDVDNWIATRVLVIDEISMVSARLWSSLAYVARYIRPPRNAPFGGLQLIVCGDFFQLPPIGDGERPCFEAPEFRECFSEPYGASIVLRHIYRQTDQSFLTLLAEVRLGRVSDEHLRSINERCCRPLSVQDGIIATRMFPLNRDVDAINSQRLDELNAVSVVYHCEDTLRLLQDDGSERANAAKALGSAHPLFGSVAFASQVTLKVGAQVMLLCNLSEQLGLVNGSRGVVVGYKPWELAKQHERNDLMCAFRARHPTIPVVKVAGRRSSVRLFNNVPRTHSLPRWPSPSMWSHASKRPTPGMHKRCACRFHWRLPGQ